MPTRYAMTQSQPKSCAAACIAVALKELGVAKHNNDKATEMRIYPKIQRGPGEESAPALVDTYLNAQSGVRAWIMESPLRTGTLMIGSKGALCSPWFEYSKELWSNWSWRYLRGVVAQDFNNDSRIMLASIIASNGLMHFILARKDGPDYYVMNPDGGKDEKHNDLFTNYINSLNPKTIGGVNYIFTGVAVWIAPSSSPWYF